MRNRGEREINNDRQTDIDRLTERQGDELTQSRQAGRDGRKD